MNARERAEKIVQRFASGEEFSSSLADSVTQDELIAAIAAAITPSPGHIIDDTGVVRKVLGTLPLTADGCVVGEDAEVWTIMGAKWKAYLIVSEDPAPIEFDPSCKPSEVYSTREAAEKSKQASAKMEDAR